MKTILNGFIAIALLIPFFGVSFAVSCYERYPYIVSSKIMELSNIREQEKNFKEQYQTGCADYGPEEFVYPKKTYMKDYNDYVVVQFRSICDLGDSVGFYKKHDTICDDGFWGCSMATYTYVAKVYKSQFKLSLYDFIK